MSELTNNGYLTIYRQYSQVADLNCVEVLNFVWQTLTELLVEILHDEFTDMIQKG